MRSFCPLVTCCQTKQYRVTARASEKPRCLGRRRQLKMMVDNSSPQRPSFSTASSNRSLFRRRALQVVGEVRNGTERSERKNKLQGRLDEQNICEIFQDGRRSHKNLSVRALYAYVVKAITMVPDQYTKSDRLRKTVVANTKVNMRMSMIGVIPESILKQGMKLDKEPVTGSHIGRLGRITEDIKNSTEQEENEAVTIRERLGNFIHPRDIRKLFFPFSATTEPEIIVRRHAVILNFDTLRAIVLRDRMLVLDPPDDSIIVDLELKIQKGFTLTTHTTHSSSEKPADRSNRDNILHSAQKHFAHKTTKNASDSGADSEDYFDKEWNEMKLGEQGEGWIDMAFELRCIDAFLETVASTFNEDANKLMGEAEQNMSNLLHTRTINGSLIRQDKDKLMEMSSRAQGFSRAINLLLDSNEDMALMNLSRLLSHPERFIQPVTQAELNEEADEPELILEAHLQETTTLLNELGLTLAAMSSTQEELNQRRDTVRNRLLYSEMILSILALAVGLASLVGSYMGMNLHISIQDDPDAFTQTVTGTTVAAVILVFLIVIALSRSGVLPRIAEL